MPRTPLVLALLLSGAAAGQDNLAGSPFPHRMPGYRFCPSIAEAVIAGGGEKRIVVFSVDTVRLENSIAWLMQQRALFAHPTTRKALAGHPIVALSRDAGEGTGLRVPTTGISVLSPRGDSIVRTIDLTTVKLADVPGLLGAILAPDAVMPEAAGPDPEFEWRNFRGLRAKVVGLVERGQPEEADRVCSAEERRAPDALGPRLLRNLYRRMVLGAEYHSRLPEDRLVADALCVVRDDAGFLRALEGWAAGPIYPILYVDGADLPAFVEAFRPARIFCVAGGGGDAVDATRLFCAYGRALGAGDAIADVAGAAGHWQKDDKRQPGVVFTHPDSPMAAAGLALAAGRRQLLSMLAPAADPTRRVRAAEVTKLSSALTDLMLKHRIDGTQLYDALDFVTLATEQPYRYVDDRAADKGTHAVDDAIARDRFDVPFAFVGRLRGDRSEALHMAMCALFLAPRQTLLFDSYHDRGGWRSYHGARAQPLLRDKGPVTLIAHPDATLERWQALFDGRRNEHGLVHVNSSGSRHNWSTSQGVGSFDDVPLTVPAIVSYVHSNSLGDGYDPDTVGGRWLHNGAYWYFGSVAEPYLDAFVTPFDAFDRALARRWPLGAAHRLLPLQQRWRAWNLMLFGDPLLRLRFGSVPRVKAVPPGGAVELAQAAAANPFGLRDADLRVFALRCAALAGDRAAVLEGAAALAVDHAALTAAQRRGVADLLAWASPHPGPGLDALLPIAAHLGAGRCASPRLSTVVHTLATARLRQLAAQPTGAGERITALLRLDLAQPHGERMCARIAELYKPVFKALPDGKRQRSELLDGVRREIAAGRRALRGFTRAF